jgi:hypothetical protein
MRQRSPWTAVLALGGACVLVGGLLAALPLFARGGLGDLVETGTRILSPALRASDLLVEVGQETTLEAALGSGLKSEGDAGRRIQFFLETPAAPAKAPATKEAATSPAAPPSPGAANKAASPPAAEGKETSYTFLGEARTDGSGVARLAWKVPQEPGDYRIVVRLHPDDQPEKPLGEATILVAARKKDANLVIVDLDKTVVASGFLSVLAGQAAPMDGAAVVLGRLSKDHTVVYLTHRPDFLAASSKRWLAQNAFPTGPVLTSTMTTLLAGSGAYKAGRLAEIKRTFPNVRVGVGDKVSDAQVYADQGVRAILILQPKWSEDDPEKFEKLAGELAALPDAVQVVSNWSEIAAILLDGASFPKQDMQKRLFDTAKDLRRRGKD